MKRILIFSILLLTFSSCGSAPEAKQNDFQASNKNPFLKENKPTSNMFLAQFSVSNPCKDLASQTKVWEVNTEKTTEKLCSLKSKSEYNSKWGYWEIQAELENNSWININYTSCGTQYLLNGSSCEKKDDYYAKMDIEVASISINGCYLAGLHNAKKVDSAVYLASETQESPCTEGYEEKKLGCGGYKWCEKKRGDILQITKYLNDRYYCEQDSDCIMGSQCCGCSPQNKYFTSQEQFDCTLVNCRRIDPLKCSSNEYKCFKNQCIFESKIDKRISEIQEKCNSKPQFGPEECIEDHYLPVFNQQTKKCEIKHYMGCVIDYAPFNKVEECVRLCEEK